jgi:enoyl-CoA hydratase/carnithine racemase
MSYETLLSEKRLSITYVTINRPEKRNALSRKVVDDLAACFRVIQADEETRVVILTGAGEKAFAAGADLAEVAALSPIEGKEFSARGQQLLDSIEGLGKPVIAAVNGPALGGGCELAMACTFRIASENAIFGQPEVKLGLIPGFGGTQRLPRLVGKGRALELILSGAPVSAQDAYRVGLVNQVVAASELIAAAENLARKIISCAPLAVKFAMEAVNRGLEMAQSDAQVLEASLFALCCATQDMKEGTRAFLEKRPAKFEGR